MPLSCAYLSSLRARALRQRVYFRALTRIERGLVDLVIRIKRQIVNERLVAILLAICDRLQRALMGFRERLRALALPHAQRLAALASRWGHPEAYLWPYDPSYLEYVGLWLYGARAGRALIGHR